MTTATVEDVKEPLTADKITDEFDEESPGIRIKKYDKVLPCALTDEEQRDRGTQLAATVEKVREVNAEKKKANDRFKQQLDDLNSEQWQLRTIIKEKKEDRTVQIEERIDFNRNMVSIIRMDTLDVVKERALTMEERQLSLLPNKRKAKPSGARKEAVGRTNA